MNKKISRLVNLSNLILILIFISFCFLRFYMLDRRIGFGWDEERDAWVAMNILSGKLTLIGPRVLSDTGFFLPPYFHYLISPFYAISGGHPVATIYFLYFYGIVFFVLTLFILKRVFGEITAVIFLLLWSVHPYTSGIDTVAWNPVLIPLLFMLLIYVLAKYSFKQSKGLLILSGLVLGLGVSFHVQFLLLAPMFLPFFYKKFFKKFLVLLAGFLVPFFPLLIFDLRHNFLNLNLLKGFLVGSRGMDFAAFVPVLNNIFPRLFGVTSPSLGYLIFFAVFLFLVFYIFRKQKENRTLWSGMIFTLLATPLAFGIYGRRPSEYYFNFLLPIVMLIAAHAFSLALGYGTKAKILAVLVITFIVFSLGATSYKGLVENKLSLYYKDKTAKFLADVTKGKGPYNVSFDVPPSEDNGFRYLFKYYGAIPTGDPQDTLFEIVIPPDKKPNTFIFGGIGLYIPEGWKKENLAK